MKEREELRIVFLLDLFPFFFFTKWFLPLNADFRITTSADRSRRHHIPVVTIAGICVQRQYVVAVNVADDRWQHYGKNPRLYFSRCSNDDWHFTDAPMRVGIFIVLWSKNLLGHSDAIYEIDWSRSMGDTDDRSVKYRLQNNYISLLMIESIVLSF